MQIFFQTRKMELSPDEKAFMARRIEGLNKFFSHYAHAYIDVEKTRGGRNGDDLYYTSIRIDDAPHHYFAEEYQADVRKSFDNAYADLYRIIRKDRSKAQRIMKSAGRRFKNLFRRKAR